MVDDGTWDVKASMTGELGAKAYVSVFAVSEKILVETSYFVEERATVQGRRRARSKDITLLIELAPIRLSVSESVRKAAPAQGISSSVQDSTIVEIQQFACEEGRLGAAFRPVDESRQPARVLLRIVVQQNYVFAARRFYSGVHRSREPPVLPKLHYTNLREVLGYEDHGFVRRAGVDEDGFKIRKSLASQG